MTRRCVCVRARPRARVYVCAGKALGSGRKAAGGGGGGRGRGMCGCAVCTVRDRRLDGAGWVVSAAIHWPWPLPPPSTPLRNARTRRLNCGYVSIQHAITLRSRLHQLVPDALLPAVRTQYVSTTVQNNTRVPRPV